MGRASLLTLAFGVFFFDYDLDGYPDIFAANGHIEEEIGRVQPKVQYQASRRCCSAISGKGRFENVVARCRPEFTRPIVARGAAYGDFDRDGDLDVLDHHQQRPGVPVPQRRRQPRTTGSPATWWARNPTATASARVVRVDSPAGKQWQSVHSGSSYCSQSDLGLTFGLGNDTKVSTIDVEWPSGQKQHLTNVAANQFVNITEPK